MNASMERRLEKLERVANEPLFCFIFPGETLNDVLRRNGIAPERADSVSWVRWKNSDESDE